MAKISLTHQEYPEAMATCHFFTLTIGANRHVKYFVIPTIKGIVYKIRCRFLYDTGFEFSNTYSITYTIDKMTNGAIYKHVDYSVYNSNETKGSYTKLFGFLKG